MLVDTSVDYLAYSMWIVPLMLYTSLQISCRYNEIYSIPAKVNKRITCINSFISALFLNKNNNTHNTHAQ